MAILTLWIIILSLVDATSSHAVVDRNCEVSTALATALDGDDAIQVVLDWMRRHDGQWPKENDFNVKKAMAGEDFIALDFNRLYGRHNYQSTNGIYRHRAYFPNGRQALLAIYRAARSDGLAILLLDAPFRSVDGITDEVRAIWREEITSLTLAWSMKNRGEQPTSSVFADPRRNGGIGVDETRIYGSGSYAEFRLDANGAAEKIPTHDLRIFSSAEEAWTHFKAAGRQQNLDYKLVFIRTRTPFSAAARQEIRYEAVHLVLDWMLRYKKVPAEPNFRGGIRGVGIDRRRLFGVSEYGPGGAQRENAIFSNQSEGLEIIAAGLALDNRFPEKLRENLLEDLKKRIKRVSEEP